MSCERSCGYREATRGLWQFTWAMGFLAGVMLGFVLGAELG